MNKVRTRTIIINGVEIQTSLSAVEIANLLQKYKELQIKQEIEQIGYKEFYRYYKEKDIYIKQLQQENKQLKEVIDKIYNNYIKGIPERYEIGEYNIKDLKDILKEVSK